MKIKIFFLMMIGVFCTSVSMANIQENVYNKVTKLATKELMIMSRIFKNYIMIQMNNHYQNPQKKIDEKIKKFNIQCSALSVLTVDKETKALLDVHEKLWRDAEIFIENPPKNASLKEFRTYFIPLRDSVQKLIKRVRKKSIGKYEESVFYAGKLFILPQRLATFYLLQGSQSQNAVKMRNQMQKEIEAYNNYLRKLDTIAKNFTPDIQELIKQLHQNLRYFQYLGGSVSVFVPTLVYKKTDRMSEKAKKLMFMLADK